ncbi:MAG: GAF domain-containing protein [Candidatus Cyclobacteriaceae bacterium M3_2C_046]
MINLKKLIHRKAFIPLLYLVTLFLVANAILLLYANYVLKKQEQIKAVASQTLTLNDDIWEQVQSSDLGVRSFLLVQDDNMLGPHTGSKHIYPGLFDQMDSLLYHQGILSKEFNAYRQRFNQKIEESDHIIELSRQGNQEKAQEIFLQDSGYDLYINYFVPFTRQLSEIENQLISQAENRYNRFNWAIRISQLLMILISVPVLIYVVNILRKNEKKRKQLYQRLSQSNDYYIFNHGDKSQEHINENQVINQITQNLEKATQFIDSITQGNYDITWDGWKEDHHQLNQNNLSGNLIKMKSQMLKARKEDQERIWISQGQAKFAEITRRNQGRTEQLFAEFISQLVKYLKINQGALFIYKESDEDSDQKFSGILEMASCYAYNREKFIEKKLAPGQGLVGQAFLEAETIYMTEIPDNYIKITSGLGEALPRNLLVVPIKYNEKVVGVLELAAFQQLETFEIQFVEETANILGATLVALQNNDLTHNLLKKTQEQAEELKGQEEEMRQNMEELEATQEEMKRQQSELEQANQQLMEENARLSSTIKTE